MDQNRQLMLFRAVIKDLLREKGIDLKANVLRRATEELKSLNERHGFNPPISMGEFFEQVVEITKELTKEYLDTLDRKLAEIQKNAPKSK